jgi:poly(ADP-ribose) glycohydrolase
MTKQGDTAIATGNWGCGVFKGDHVLKFLIQLIAISASNKSGMLYHTFGDDDLQQALFHIHGTILRKHQTTSKFSIWKTRFFFQFEN